MKNLLKIGKIVKPQGIKGEVKVLPYVDELSPFNQLKQIWLDGKQIEIVRARVVGSDVFLCLSGIIDRNTAEELRGKELSLPHDEALPFAGDGYFISDLIGVEIYVDSQKVGVIKEVIKGHTDVLVVDGEKPFMIPYLKKLIVREAVFDKIIELDKIEFDKVVLYED